MYFPKCFLALHGHFEKNSYWQYFIYGKRISMNFCECALPVIISFPKIASQVPSVLTSTALQLSYLSHTAKRNLCLHSTTIHPCSLKRILILGKYHNHCAIMLAMNHYIFCLPSPINFVSILCKAGSCQLKLCMTHIEITSLDKVLENYFYLLHLIAEIVNSYWFEMLASRPCNYSNNFKPIKSSGNFHLWNDICLIIVIFCFHFC